MTGVQTCALPICFANFKYQDLFYSTFLEPLFEALDEPNRPNDIFTVTNTRVPYLSGGLFELEDKKTKNINFPAKYFNDLFEFLDRYNFTIDENDTNDHEVGIDPEMLGHIFENLLEDNKDKGAFYTPKEIVRYMCQESLKEYLKTSLENNKQWPTDETEAAAFEQSLHNFVTKKEAGGIIEFEETIARALKDVKICDPAIGSGAFPMGLLNEIFQLVHKLHEANKDKVERVWELKGWQPNLVKQNIIQNSIYGVDIEKGAVDVARLRFWLSLIVDEPEPKALPHLDYKIVVGNSLVSKLDDTIIDIDWEVKEEQTDLFGNENKERQQQLLNEISAKQKLVFDPNSNEEKLSLEIRNLKIDLLINQLDAMVKTKGITVKPTGTGKTIKAQTELWLETIGWKQQIEKLQKLKKSPNETLHFFDWKLDFPEIMNEQVTDKVGFDIVIANPPYVDYRQIETSITKNNKYPINLKANRPNLYQYFIELSDYLISKKGIFCFINPNQFLSTDNGYQLRKNLLEKKRIKFITDVSYVKIFEEAATYTVVWLYKNEYIINNNININRCYDLKNLKDITFKINQSEINNIETKIIPINIEFFLLQKIEKDKKRLSDISELKWGTSASGYGKKKIKKLEFESLSENNKKLYKPILQTSDTKSYFIDWQEEFIPINIYSDNIIKEFNKDKILIGRLTKKIQACIDLEKRFVGKTTLITNSKIDLKILLAILNSNFINKWYYLKFETTHMAGGYLRYDIPYLSQIPIPTISINQIDKIKNIVENIIEKKKKGEFTLDLEQQIDNLVYKLYALTYDEVLVVEPEFSERMSREVYEGLKVE